MYERVFKVVFRKEKDGKVLLSRKVPAGSKIDPPNGRAGAGFVKWSTDEYKNVQKDLDIYAIYTEDGSTGGDKDDGDGPSATLIIIIAAAAVVVIGGVIVAIILVKKKKNA